MIEVIELVKDVTDHEAPQFYKLVLKYPNQGPAYSGTTLFSTEADLRTVLKAGGIADAAINQLFANGQ